MTGVEVALLGAAASGATATAAATAATAGLFGTAGVFSLGSTLGTLGTIASLGSSFLGSKSQQKQGKAQQVATRTNAAIDRTNSAEQEIATRRDAYMRTGSNIAAAGMGGGATGSALDILADNAAQDELNIIGIRRNSAVTQDLATSNITASKSSAKLQKYSGILSGATDAYKMYKGL